MFSTETWIQRLPFLKWPRPTTKLLQSEGLAGITVGLMLVPQGIAYALLAGMPLVTGIYASMLPALVAVLFSASPRLSVGPTALSCLLISASLTGLAEPASMQWVALAGWLAILSGLLQMALGFLRSGWLLSLVNAPVLMAFTQGAAILIIGSQLLSMLGVQGGWSGAISQPVLHWPSLAFGILSYLVLVLAKRFSNTFPTVLLVVVGAAIASSWTGYEKGGGSVVGDIPSGLPIVILPTWPGWGVLSQLILPTLLITLVSFLETASSARVDNQGTGVRWDREQDLIGHGLAKMAAGMSGAFPTSTSFSRSALNRYAGAKTGWSVVFSVLVVALALVFAPMLHSVPMPVLAAVVIAAVQNLIAPSEFRKLWKVSRVEAVIALVTFLVTVLSAPRLYWGVITGVVMALSHFLYVRLNPRIVEVGLHPDGSLRDRHLWNLPSLGEHTYAVRMDEALDFATANDFERNISHYLVKHPLTRHLMLIAHPINRIDATGVEAFSALIAQVKALGISLHLVGLKLPVEKRLKSAGLLEPSPQIRMYRTENEVLRTDWENTESGRQDAEPKSQAGHATINVQ